ncbi:Cyclic nucleotide-binding protein [Pseudocohnilembus persalinus]|uniref:Cyclic nucleotide-binding protein n=1 Tax=Pseudocohnilembus persalinus TaxID=266149 RepID=A0A0V0QKA7_PSEPJ|nr:Cyclic nucleotide-binding protein [Pseudocohnilembus persalinus]|eukprot:KRX02647.1 Cyclic nucleotide-binding protein [Pseudocohnilembus persalinus]
MKPKEKIFSSSQKKSDQYLQINGKKQFSQQNLTNQLISSNRSHLDQNLLTSPINTNQKNSNYENYLATEEQLLEDQNYSNSIRRNSQNRQQSFENDLILNDINLQTERYLNHEINTFQNKEQSQPKEKAQLFLNFAKRKSQFNDSENSVDNKNNDLVEFQEDDFNLSENNKSWKNKQISQQESTNDIMNCKYQKTQKQQQQQNQQKQQNQQQQNNVENINIQQIRQIQNSNRGSFNNNLENNQNQKGSFSQNTQQNNLNINQNGHNFEIKIIQDQDEEDQINPRFKAFQRFRTKKKELTFAQIDKSQDTSASKTPEEVNKNQNQNLNLNLNLNQNKKSELESEQQQQPSNNKTVKISKFLQFQGTQDTQEFLNNSRQGNDSPGNTRHLYKQKNKFLRATNFRQVLSYQNLESEPVKLVNDLAYTNISDSYFKQKDYQMKSVEAGFGKTSAKSLQQILKKDFDTIKSPKNSQKQLKQILTQKFDKFHSSNLINPYEKKKICWDLFISFQILIILWIYPQDTILGMNGMASRYKTQTLTNIFSLVKLFLLVVFAGHLLCLLWLGVSEIVLNNEWGNNTWVINMGLADAHWLTQYFWSYYFSMQTMTTVGYGDVTPVNVYEAVILIFSMAAATMMFGYTINAIGLIFEDLTREGKLIKRQTSLLNRYLENKKVPNYLKIKEEQIKQQLPPELFNEIQFQQSKNFLEKNYIFKQFSKDFIERLAMKMKQKEYEQNQTIFQQGDLESNPCFYFLISGEISFSFLYTNIHKQALVFKNLTTEGVGFGEYSFLTGEKRQSAAQAYRPSTLLYIKKNDFLEILAQSSKKSLNNQTYCMLRDKMIYGTSHFDVNIQCFCCKLIGHTLLNCPQLHYQADKEKVILQEKFQSWQLRQKSFVRQDYNYTTKALNPELIIPFIDENQTVLDVQSCFSQVKVSQDQKMKLYKQYSDILQTDAGPPELISDFHKASFNSKNQKSDEEEFDVDPNRELSQYQLLRNIKGSKVYNPLIKKSKDSSSILKKQTSNESLNQKQNQEDNINEEKSNTVSLTVIPQQQIEKRDSLQGILKNKHKSSFVKFSQVAQMAQDQSQKFQRQPSDDPFNQIMRCDSQQIDFNNLNFSQKKHINFQNEVINDMNSNENYDSEKDDKYNEEQEIDMNATQVQKKLQKRSMKHSDWLRGHTKIKKKAKVANQVENTYLTERYEIFEKYFPQSNFDPKKTIREYKEAKYVLAQTPGFGIYTLKERRINILKYRQERRISIAKFTSQDEQSGLAKNTAISLFQKIAFKSFKKNPNKSPKNNKNSQKNTIGPGQMLRKQRNIVIHKNNTLQDNYTNGVPSYMTNNYNYNNYNKNGGNNGKNNLGLILDTQEDTNSIFEEDMHSGLNENGEQKLTYNQPLQQDGGKKPGVNKGLFQFGQNKFKNIDTIQNQLKQQKENQNENQNTINNNPNKDKLNIQNSNMQKSYNSQKTY